MPLVVGNRCSSNRAPHLPQRPYGLFSRWSFPPEPTIFHDARRVSGASLFEWVRTAFRRSSSARPPSGNSGWRRTMLCPMGSGSRSPGRTQASRASGTRRCSRAHSASAGSTAARGAGRHHFLQRFTPRRPRSKWSRINRDTAERLIAPGGCARPVRRGRTGERGRPLGSRLQGQRERPCPTISSASSTDCQGQGLLRRAEQPEPLRDPLPAAGSQEAGDARAKAGEVRRDARGRRDDPPLGADARSDRADAQAVSHVHPSHARGRARLAEPASRRSLSPGDIAPKN